MRGDDGASPSGASCRNRRAMLQPISDTILTIFWHSSDDFLSNSAQSRRMRKTSPFANRKGLFFGLFAATVAVTLSISSSAQACGDYSSMFFSPEVNDDGDRLEGVPFYSFAADSRVHFPTPKRHLAARKHEQKPKQAQAKAKAKAKASKQALAPLSSRIDRGDARGQRVSSQVWRRARHHRAQSAGGAS